MPINPPMLTEFEKRCVAQLEATQRVLEAVMTAYGVTSHPVMNDVQIVYGSNRRLLNGKPS